MFSLDKGDEVEVFLTGKGVEAEEISTEEFDVEAKINEFAEKGGKIYACGTCVEIRKNEELNHCPISTLQEMYDVVKNNEKVITF